MELKRGRVPTDMNESLGEISLSLWERARVRVYKIIEKQALYLLCPLILTFSLREKGLTFLLCGTAVIEEPNLKANHVPAPAFVPRKLYWLYGEHEDLLNALCAFIGATDAVTADAYRVQ
jgi:hypothetical protein